MNKMPREEARKLMLRRRSLIPVDLRSEQDRLDESAEKAWKEAHPRKKRPKKENLRAWKGYAPLLEEAKARVAALEAAYKYEKKVIETAMGKLVEKGLKPLPGEQKAKWKTTSSYTYTTQTASGSYAKGQAEMEADVARLYEIPVEIVKSEDSRKDYDVVVSVADAELDLWILGFMPPPSLAEQVRRCWARGLNPRVYDPFLPYDFEKKHGITYQGTYREGFKAPG